MQLKRPYSLFSSLIWHIIGVLTYYNLTSFWIFRATNYMFNYIKNIKLSRLEIKSGAEYDGSQKQNIVLSQLSVLVMVISAIHFIDDTLAVSSINEDLIWLSMVEFLMFLISLITYILNEKGKHRIAKHFFLFSMNILLFFLNTVAPKESGSYFFFFPLMSATFIFYGYSDEVKRYFYLLLTATLFIILTIYNFDLFGIMVDMDTDYDFFTNLISSLILMAMTVGFLITLNKRTESDLLNSQLIMKALMDDLNEKNINLEKVNTELDRFVYSVSHDLRAPLMSILGLINLSKMEKSAEGHVSYLSKMQNMVNKLDNFIHEVIDYTRNIKAQVEQKEVDIESLIQEIIDDLKFMPRWEKIDFQIEVKLEEVFITDLARVSTMLKNFITNSIKYYNINEPNPFIRVKVMSRAGQKIIEVSDNGIGIEEKYQPKIFNMFFRGTDRSTGSGLGLFIVKEMVNKLGGKLELNSKLGKGSTFTVII